MHINDAASDNALCLKVHPVLKSSLSHVRLTPLQGCILLIFHNYIQPQIFFTADVVIAALANCIPRDFL